MKADPEGFWNDDFLGGSLRDGSLVFLHDYTITTTEFNDPVSVLKDYKISTAFFKGKTPKSMAEDTIPVFLPQMLYYL